MAASSLQNNASNGNSISTGVRQSLRNQVLYGFITLIALLILVGGIALFTQLQTARSVDVLVNVEGRSSNLVIEIERQIATMRRIQSDYTFQSAELGFDVARLRYFSEWEDLLEATRNDLLEADGLRSVSEEAGESRINLILAQLKLYEIRFNYLVNLYEAQGSFETGVRGKVQTSIDTMDSYLDSTPELASLTPNFQAMRGHERDFLISGERITLEKFHEAETELLDAAVALELSSTELAKVEALVADYAHAFRELHDIVDEIQEVELRTGTAMDTAAIMLSNETRGAQERQQQVQEEVNNFGRIENLLIPAAVILASAFGLWLAFRLANRIGKQANNLVNVASNIENGRYNARAEVTSDDEFGLIAQSLNRMLDNTVSLIQSESERDEIQESIMTLLEEVSTVAEGDLTAQAEVRSDMTGAIADSVNFMIEQLREIITNVQTATLEVSTSANQIQTTAGQLAAGSESQASQIVDTTAAVDEMSISIQQVSENAARSASVGEQARENAQLGAQAVHATIGGMDRIRDEVEQTAERLGRLEATSREIGKITEVISNLAERTSILAINASIQASEAGEAGRGFSVVAKEVELLADRSSSASQQINRLVKIIQDETGEVTSAMSATSREVSRGTQLAAEAGQRLDDIETVSSQLANLIQSISQAAQQQARGSEAIAQSMNDIADVTKLTASGTKDANTSIGKLAELADTLRASVSQFKLYDEVS